eukprot:366242-Chlamydomonas_euryale.AAC.2
MAKDCSARPCGNGPAWVSTPSSSEEQIVMFAHQVHMCMHLERRPVRGQAAQLPLQDRALT